MLGEPSCESNQVACPAVKAAGLINKLTVRRSLMADDIVGDYRLLKCMMSGQTSQVWEVVEVSSHRHFAMKLLLPERGDDAEARRMLLHEAEVGKKLAHQNVIRITYFSKDPKNPYFVMEYFPAGSLKLRLARKDFAFIKDRAHSIFKQAATGFAYINASGWVHRDIKPDNILVSQGGELRIIDLALAQRIQKATIFAKLFRKRGKAQGTRSYMSPEQIRNQILDQRADIYSFGATAYELVTGRPPFRGGTEQDLLTKQIIEKPVSPQAHNSDVTKEFSELILRMLAKKREDRPRDFHEILMALRNMKIFKSDAAVSKEQEQ
jgi:serine/threonine protein kinase